MESMEQIPGQRSGQSTLSLVPRAATRTAIGEIAGLILLDAGGASIGTDNTAELTLTDGDATLTPLTFYASRHSQQSEHAMTVSPDEGNSRDQLELMRDQINDQEMIKLYEITPPPTPIPERAITSRDQRDGEDESNPIVIDSDEEDQQGLENEDQQGMENEDQRGLENEDQRGLENEDQWGMENEDPQGMENEDQQGLENEDQWGMEETEQIPSPAKQPKIVRFLQTLPPEQQPAPSNSTLADPGIIPERTNTSEDQRDSTTLVDSDEEGHQPTMNEDQQRMEQSQRTPSPAPSGTSAFPAAAVRFSLPVQDIGTPRQGGAASVNTATTRGGCTFEDLSRGSLVNYACDHLVRIDGSTGGIDEAEKKIHKNVEDCITEIELQSDKKVRRLYFGKTFIRRRKQGRKKYAKFDCMDHTTWKKSGGISGRWQGHKGKDYAKNGMVVLAAIHRKSIPRRCRKDVHQEDYALALEQRLIQHYLFREGDERLENKTLTAGGSDGKGSIAYALYMTFTLEDSQTSPH